MIRRKLSCIGLLVAIVASGVAQADERLFPRPESLEPAIRFWTRVYTEIDTRAGFIHDSLRLDIVYETIRSDRKDRAPRRQAVNAAIARYKAILTKLGSGARSGLDGEARRVLALFPKGTGNEEFRRAAERLRFQLGQADRFRAGLIRAGAWRSYIDGVLDANGVPRLLAALPHVESSFDPTAYSKAGAAGMWQFTRSTGLRYMRIDHIVDERRDPFMSTDAAARLLRDNYEVLGQWPLAITAYNHGVGGMRRAVAQLGTADIGVIIERYNGRTFGFASRNFYPAFLAAVDIDAEPEKYFGPLRPHQPANTLVATVPDYMRAETLARAFDLPRAELERLNPALTEAVWSGDKFVPKGFALRVPRRGATADARQLLAAVPAAERYAAQQPDVQHRVRSGETLSQIAARYRVSLASLVRLNGLRSSHFIRAGQVLRLPVPADGVSPSLAEQGDIELAAAGSEYVVRRGDSIERIASRLGVHADTLVAANSLRDKDLIYAGQRLRLPGSELGDAAGAQDADPATGSPPAGGPAAGTRAGAVAAALAVETGADEAELAAEALGALLAETAAGDPAGRSAEATLRAELDAAGTEAAALDADAALDSNVLASHQADLAADPSDYSVSDGLIQVQPLETLGHYADWLEIRTQRLRDLNAMPFTQAVVIGQALKLDFSRVTPEEFERRRIAYQQRRQEAFFSSYHIEDVEEHVIRRGESLWVLAQRTYNVPVWLLRQYNPDIDLDRIAPGTVVKIPRLRPIAEDEAQVST